ncbi:Non-structural maintenance of chromosomes element 1 [Blyttiomyces sp. JEL0837]|nr:Non-structural maintenance of chromosomes element 1 [Blyttiomyces sp. JEL0837]
MTTTTTTSRRSSQRVSTAAASSSSSSSHSTPRTARKSTHPASSSSKRPRGRQSTQQQDEDDEDEERNSDDDDNLPATGASASVSAQGIGADAVTFTHSLMVGSKITNVHRLFLNSWLSIRFTNEAQALSVYRKCSRYSPNQFDGFVRELNETLHHLDFEMVKTTAPDTGDIYWAMVNVNGDDIAQVATELANNEIQLFKHIIGLIVNADDELFEVSSMAALRDVGKLRPAMTKKEAETTILKLVKEGWLVDSAGYLSLGLRSLMELKSYLTEEFEASMHTCSLCQQLVTTHYERCSVGTCTGRLHQICATRYFAATNKRVCPVNNCGVGWRGEKPSRNKRATPKVISSGSGSGAGASLERNASEMGSEAHYESGDEHDGGEKDDEEAEREGEEAVGPKGKRTRVGSFSAGAGGLDAIQEDEKRRGGGVVEEEDEDEVPLRNTRQEMRAARRSVAGVPASSGAGKRKNEE